jgi:hypothetical protein
MTIKQTKSTDETKQHIIDLFVKNVKNKEIKIMATNKKHNGVEGHWLETQMEIKHNSKNNPDILGNEERIKKNYIW